ncbi:MAG: DUF2252 domain-containing protein [candidate division KSB1 bacterium]
MPALIERLSTEKPEARQKFIIESFTSAYSDLMQADADAWRGKFRKMAVTPFAFYRGSAALFYADMIRDEEPFVDKKTSRVWIQGDLHAENFGTYLNSKGVLVFDVNDFDEAYVAPFTWDLKRLVASLALIGFQKALSDQEIRDMIKTFVLSYVTQVTRFAAKQEASDFALRLDNTKGKLLELLQKSRLQTRVDLLNSNTTIENYDRRFASNKILAPVDEAMRAKVLQAFEQYLKTIPQSKRLSAVSYHVKDVCAVRGVGIGSAGLKIYSILLEGPTQTLENDIIISMKQAQTAAPSRVITDAAIRKAFVHDGHRTVMSQRALQAYSDPWLGHTVLEGKGQFVAEFSPYTGDLSWDDINKTSDMLDMLNYLGQAVAKIHCVSDDDSDHTLVPFSIEAAIHESLRGREEKFVEAMVSFGAAYGDIVRDDYRLFIDAFRNHMFPGL